MTKPDVRPFRLRGRGSRIEWREDDVDPLLGDLVYLRQHFILRVDEDGGVSWIWRRGHRTVPVEKVL